MIKVVVTNDEGEVREFEGKFYSIVIGDNDGQSMATEGIVNPLDFLTAMARHTAIALRTAFNVKRGTPVAELTKKTFISGFNVFFERDDVEPDVYRMEKVEK